MAPRKGFWQLIIEAAPSEPGRPILPFRATLDRLASEVNAGGLRCPVSVVDLALRSAGDWNPSFPWRVASAGPGMFAFTPK